MSGGTVVPRHQCPGGHFFQGDSHASDTAVSFKLLKTIFPCSDEVFFFPYSLPRKRPGLQILRISMSTELYNSESSLHSSMRREMRMPFRSSD